MLCSADTRRQTQSQSKTSHFSKKIKIKRVGVVPPEFENESQSIKLHSCIPKKKKFFLPNIIINPLMLAKEIFLFFFAITYTNYFFQRLQHFTLFSLFSSASLRCLFLRHHHKTIQTTLSIYKQAFCFLTYGLLIPIELWFLFALLGVFLEVEFLIKSPLNEWGYHVGWTHNTSLSSEDRL